jgi:hypothetical protein
LAKALKYRIEFNSGDNFICRCDFYYEGFTGDMIELEHGARPFVLKEFNSDDNIFKPIRAMMAEIEIVTNVNGVQIEDFYADNDSDIELRFFFNNNPYWRGYVLQDDFQEAWDDTNHILIIRAADGFGLLKGFQFKNGDTELVGKYTPWEMLGYAMNRLPNTPFNDYYVFNNLYHRSMVETSGGVNQTPLTQCFIDAKTFQEESINYESCYTAIEKINSAFSQTVFMYLGSWWFLRVEELYTSYSGNLRGLYHIGGANYNLSKRYDVEAGVGREIEPITPEMLRLIKKKTKFDEIDFTYEPFSETFLNETFARGQFISAVGNAKEYSLDDWIFQSGTFTTPTTPSSDFECRIREVFMSSTAGGLLERYVYIESLQAAGSTSCWLLSNEIPITLASFVNITLDVKKLRSLQEYAPVVYVVVESSAGYYWLNEEGVWTFVSSLGLVGAVRLDSRAGTNVQTDEWNTLQIESDIFPADGLLTIRLHHFNNITYTNSITYFKNLKVEVLTGFENGDFRRKITGINSKYEKTDNIVNSNQVEVFLDDHYSALHKGAIFESDEETLTDADWYRYRYSSESFGFRRQNATAQWEHNRFNRNKIDCNFFGLVYVDGPTFNPIGLVNTIKFVDDDVNKVYWIANLREIDFAAGTWSATLEEVYDQLRDVDTTETFEANFTLQTYVISLPYTFTVPLTLVTAGGFSIQSGNSARYDGLPTLSTPIECSIFGTMSAPSYPSSVTFQLQKNGTSIKTITLPIYYANFPYTLNLSVGATTIATNDIFKVVVNGASNLVVGGGDMKVNIPSTTQTYDTYTDNYIYK